jgi:ADP-ribose pyrophosphatase YjhB (NUDIX family)
VPNDGNVPRTSSGDREVPTPAGAVWVRWARELQATAQSGLAYAQNPFDRQRYESIRQIAAEMIAHQSQLSTAEVLRLLSVDIGYCTPKVDVRGAVFQDDAILLVRERQDGRWTLPGGWADVNESPSEAVVREIREESGYRAAARRLVAVYDRDKQGHTPRFPVHVYKLFFQCDCLGCGIADTIETDAADFFKEAALPELSLGRVTPAQVHRLFEHLRAPDLPADFD